MLAAGPATQTRPGGTHFLTVDTIIQKGLKSVVVTQSFALPQGTWNVTLPNGTIIVTHIYVGEIPLNMTASIFNVVVLEPQGYKVPCTMYTPVFDQAQATLNPDDPFGVVQRRYNRTWRNRL